MTSKINQPGLLSECGPFHQTPLASDLGLSCTWWAYFRPLETFSGRRNLARLRNILISARIPLDIDFALSGIRFDISSAEEY